MEKASEKIIIKSIVGPLQADEFFYDSEIITNYISLKGESLVERDPLIAAILDGEKLILTGVRGTGKTMALKTSEALLKQNIKNRFTGEIENLPVSISFAGFKKEVSLQEETDMNDEELKIAKEVFRGYFFMTLLDAVLGTIEELELDNNVAFNLFGIRTKLGIKKEINKAVQTFRTIGFKELIRSKTSGANVEAGINIKAIELKFTPEMINGETTQEVTLNDMQKTALFKKTIESICSVYSIQRIQLLFDEVYYLKFLQPEFFDILFGFRNYKKVTFAISAYPTYMDLGEDFDIPDDAKEVNVSSILYKPTKIEFERPLIRLVESRLSNFGNMDIKEAITLDALEYLILLTNGNPRMLLQAIDYIWQKNAKKIRISNITNDILIYMVNSWYIDFMKKQAKRYKTNINKVEDFLKVVIKRLKERNERSEVASTFFLISDDIKRYFNDTIDVLHYSRIIDTYKIGDFGGGTFNKGQTYFLNPMVAISFGVFSKNQISNLVSHIKNSIEKDRKIQFENLEKFLVEFEAGRTLSCPRFLDGNCVDAKCKGTYSEEWTICPFHPGLSLEVSEDDTGDELELFDTSVLNISSLILERLKEAGVSKLQHILDLGYDGLVQISYIGDVRARNILYLTNEFINDNI
ncbi:hypothetical protein LC040_00430 [Bacillus tianshenii]|nr:hypothetical protein LC040_00430 [Bacillus tianshenii]